MAIDAAALKRRLVDARVDVASLAAFRILFGVLMAVAMVRLLLLGWIDDFYVAPEFHFTWEWLPWVRPWPGWLMHAHVIGLGVLATAMALGLFYRASSILFFLGFTYLELLDKTTYLNHYYLIGLLAGILVCVPAHRAWSIDAWRRPALATRCVPAWTVNLLRFQIAVVYVFAGLAKLDRDWLLHAQPLRLWLAARSDLPVVGPVLAEPWVAFVFSWGGAMFDLTIVGFLLWGRTRIIAYAAVVVFHAMTAVLFPIGMFPWIMIAATLIFFPPDWPYVFRKGARVRGLGSFDRTPVPTSSVWLLMVYVFVQLAVPLRSYWPGTDPHWTGRGFNFAWRVMIVEKAGHAEFIATEPATGRRWSVRTRDYITERQEKMMAQDPFMVRALARHISVDLAARGVRGVEVRAESFAALNGGRAERLIDPDVNLSVPTPPGWILPSSRDR